MLTINASTDIRTAKCILGKYNPNKKQRLHENKNYLRNPEDINKDQDTNSDTLDNNITSISVNSIDINPITKSASPKDPNNKDTLVAHSNHNPECF
jgi:hypothetical protein